MWISKIKNFVVEVIFPKSCLECRKEGDYLCQDCLAVLDILSIHQISRTKNLNDLYFAASYSSPLIKKLIQSFKYEPFIKELAKTLSSLIINHFQLLEKQPIFPNHVLIPVPLRIKRLKWRGFNQSEEIGKELAKYLKLPLSNNVLIKTKETPAQVELDGDERRENLKKVFVVENKNLINGKKILLIDDVYTTGATMEECAMVLKTAGAKEVIGVAVARAKPEEDKISS